MNGITRLYTPELLGLAVRLADYPYNAAFEWKGSARSPSCGSTVELGLSLDGAGRIAEVGMQVHACAIGQAAAAIFADAAQGRSAPDIAQTLGAMKQWLETGGQAPDWPAIQMIAAARAFPGRHGAMLLPWQAALQALSNHAPQG